MSKKEEAESVDWVVATADRVLAARERRGWTEHPVVIASGISPSGPIHLGNLREVLVPHFVSEELRRRGVETDHILSWDDYDRLRKVPPGFDPSLADHIGRPLSAIPDPQGELPSWAERFKVPFRAALAQLGVEVREISQTEAYQAGAYTDAVVRAMEARDVIDTTLGQFRTLARDEEPDDDASYYPFRVYCEECGRDTTEIVAWVAATAMVTYQCQCGHAAEYSLRDRVAGKLVWKVDWPMRWAHEGVLFEAGGVDHSGPNSSYRVGSDLVRQVFDAAAPEYLPYAFVGIRGQAKLSGSGGAGYLPGDALSIIEAPIVRWLYARRRPNQSITIDFGSELYRVYDEWDAFSARASASDGGARDVALHQRATVTSLGELPATPRPVAFRMLTSVVDITQGADGQILRILRDAGSGAGSDGPEAAGGLAEFEPRLTCARAWVAERMPPEQRTTVRSGPDLDTMAGLDGRQREAIGLLLDRLDERWSLDGLTGLVYAVPKLQAGLAEDDPPSPEAKQGQKEFFGLLYRLLCGRDTGPRLPTLLLALGPDRIRALLAPAVEA